MPTISYVYDRANLIDENNVVVGLQLEPGHHILSATHIHADEPRHYYIITASDDGVWRGMWTDEVIAKGVAKVVPRFDEVKPIGTTGDQLVFGPDGLVFNRLP